MAGDDPRRCREAHRIRLKGMEVAETSQPSLLDDPDPIGVISWIKIMRRASKPKLSGI
jgi:hypothetical protein